MNYKETYQEWLSNPYFDEDTKKELTAIENDENEIKEAVEFCHEHNVKVYITVNILAHNADFTGMVDYLKYLDSVHVDGVIVSDLGIAHLVKEYTNLELLI